MVFWGGFFGLGPGKKATLAAAISDSGHDEGSFSSLPVVFGEIQCQLSVGQRMCFVFGCCIHDAVVHVEEYSADRPQIEQSWATPGIVGLSYLSNLQLTSIPNLLFHTE